MPAVVIATVDVGHALVIVEALDDAGIPCEVVELKPFTQLEYLRHQQRPRADIEVDAEQEAAARGVLERLSLENEQALAAEMESGVAPGEALVARGDAPLLRAKSRGLGAIFALLVPVLGPIYADAPVLVVASVIVHIPLLMFVFSASHMSREVVLMSWALGRMVDLAGTLRRIAQYNDALPKLAASTQQGETPHAS